MNEGKNHQSSVVVVGAGIQGVCISLFLIKKGFKVTLKPFLIRNKDIQTPCIPAPMTPIEDFIYRIEMKISSIELSL